MKRILEMVTEAIGFGGDKRVGSGECLGTCQVFARIEEPLMPLQRGTKYEDPLNRALTRARLGRVTGGGSVQGADGGIEWVSLDLRLVDVDAALEFARAKLRELGAPKGSVVKFKKDDVVITTLI